MIAALAFGATRIGPLLSFAFAIQTGMIAVGVYSPEALQSRRFALLRLLAANWTFGRLTVLLPNGETHQLDGPQPGPTAVFDIKDYRFARRVLASGDIGFAEAYMAGEWESPHLAALLEAFRDAGDLSVLRGPLWTVTVLRDLTALGGVTVLSLIVFCAAALFVWRGQRATAARLIGAVVSGQILSNGLKALLDRAGGGNYMMQVSFAALGHLRGGPAKVAVVSSALNGMISGSSVSNVVSGGIFTIPLMKKAGYGGIKAGAIETMSSVNGQIMPPVMGAAAFLMVEYVGIPYIEVMKHAFLPAIISYIALLYIVHLEALKANMVGLPRRGTATAGQRLMSFAMTVAGFIVLSGAVYWGIGWIKTAMGDAAIWVVGLVTFADRVERSTPAPPPCCSKRRWPSSISAMN